MDNQGKLGKLWGTSGTNPLDSSIRQRILFEIVISRVRTSGIRVVRAIKARGPRSAPIKIGETINAANWRAGRRTLVRSSFPAIGPVKFHVPVGPSD